jgi:TUG ubiquitin-like domain
MPPNNENNITITAAGAEGDTAPIKVNAHQHLRQVLSEALKELYGAPGPDPAEYDIVFGGTILDLDKTVEEAGIVNGSEIAVLPKDVSRG